MAGGTKRLKKYLREQQMLDAAVEVFSENGFHETSMDAIAARASISKPMLYLYYGSKDELFAACVGREGQRFVEALTPAGDPTLPPRAQLRVALESFLGFVDEHRHSWMVLYRQALAQQAFASQVRGIASQGFRFLFVTFIQIDCGQKNVVHPDFGHVRMVSEITAEHPFDITELFVDS